jgi:hypothetical protein
MAISFKRGLYINHHLNLLLHNLCLGIVGTFIVLLTTIKYFLYSLNNIAFEEWLENLFPTSNRNESDVIYETIKYGLFDKETEYIESYLDLMTYGSTIDKQTLIARAVQYFKPSFAPIILRALNDKDNIIRVQAAASINKVNDSFYQNYKEHEAKLLDSDNLYKNKMQFSMISIEYIESGILDPNFAKKIKVKNVLNLKECIDIMPNDETPKFLLARLYFTFEDYNEAFSILDLMIEKGKFFIPELILLYLSVLYKLNKISTLKGFVRKIKNKEVTVLYKLEELDDVLEVWSTQEISLPEWGSN